MSLKYRLIDIIYNRKLLQPYYFSNLKNFTLANNLSNVNTIYIIVSYTCNKFIPIIMIENINCEKEQIIWQASDYIDAINNLKSGYIIITNDYERTKIYKQYFQELNIYQSSEINNRYYFTKVWNTLLEIILTDIYQVLETLI